MVGKMKCFNGECKLKLATIVAVQYKLRHHIRHVLVKKSGVGST